jgi:hypothetical protein
MFTRVNIEESAWTNPAFAKLAKYLGYADGRHALINCAALWSWQTDNYSPEKPTYVVDADTIDVCLGKTDAGPAMVRAGLAEEVPDGFRIRGSEGRIEWLWRCRSNAPKGGDATRRLRSEGERREGSRPAVDCKASDNGVPTGPATGKPPAGPTPPPTAEPSLVLLSGREEEREDAATPLLTSQASSKAKPRRPPSGPHQEAIDHLDQLYRSANDGQRHDWRGKNSKLMAELVGEYGVAEVKRRTDILFAGKGPHWLSPPFTVGTLSSQWNNLASESRQPGRPGAPADAIRPTTLLT